MKETPMIRGTSLQEINSCLNDCCSIFLVNHDFLDISFRTGFGNNYYRRDGEQHAEQG